MNIFHRKTPTPHIRPATIPTDHLAALAAYASVVRYGRVYALKENANNRELIV
jgi:hypothetical protein